MEWQRLRDNLDDPQGLTLNLSGKRFRVRTPAVGKAGKALQAAGVALGPPIQPIK